MRRIILFVAILLPFAACKVEDPDVPEPTNPLAVTIPDNPPTTTIPSGTTSSLSAPQVVSPQPGTQLENSQPTLTVTNATAQDGSTPAYFFRVGTDPAMTDVVASGDNIPEGTNGQTSWTVPTPLESGTFYWGAQARLGADFGPASNIVNFSTPGAPAATLPRPGSGILISDTLTNGTTAGQVSGGVFTRQGWQVTSHRDYIRYEVPTIESGFVEWENTGFWPRNPNDGQYILFGMWDPTRGDYRANPFRVHVQKLDDNHNRPYIRLRWIADGEQRDSGYNFMNWDPSRTYHWRVDWGPSGAANLAQVYLDGQLIIEILYRNPYRPEAHWIELGVAERQESIVGVTYSNFQVGSR